MSAPPPSRDAGEPRCPFCRAKLAATNLKRLSSSYMRCDACGQLWHPDRLQATRAVNRDRR